MLKTILMSTLVSSMLLLSGCGGDDEGEAKLEIQKMLDKGDFNGVISRLEKSADNRDDYVTLASAYMGKAGLTITDIITAISSGEEEGSQDNSGFADFVKKISSASDKSSTPLADLDTARDYFKKVVGEKCTNGAVTRSLSDVEKNVCLYIGMASTGSAAVTIDLIAGDIGSFGSGDGEDYKLKASTCALNYAFDRTNDSDCTVSSLTDVKFTLINKTFTPLEITVSGDPESNTYHYLMNDANRTVLTKDYCLADDFTRYEDINAISGLYACPINENPDRNDTTTAGVLVDILNDGISSIANAVAGDVVDDINEFKCEILDGSYNSNNECISNTNNATIDLNSTDVDESAIIEYLNKENK